MNEEETKQLSELLAAKKYDEAKILIRGFFNRPLSAEERGALYLEMADIYLQTMGGINQKYIEGMEGIVAGLEQAETVGAKLSDKVKLANLREELKK